MHGLTFGRGGISIQPIPPRWIRADVPRRAFRFYTLAYGLGIAAIMAIVAFAFAISGNYKALLPPAVVVPILSLSYVYLRRLWPREVAVGVEGLWLKFSTRRTRFIPWQGVREVNVMPASSGVDEWLRIRYQDGHEETQVLIVDRTAYYIAREFERVIRRGANQISSRHDD